MEKHIIKTENYNADSVLSLALDLGKSMIKCGAEISRVEETVIRICHAYNLRQVSVFSVISMITATAVSEDCSTYTQMRRIYSSSNDLGKLEKLNALSREICQSEMSVDEAKSRLESINASGGGFRLSALLGSMLAAGGFTVFFGGTLLDALASMPIAIVIYLMNTFIKTSSLSKLFYTALCSAVSGFLALFFVKIGFGTNAGTIMIGDIMLIIPGLMLINSMREMLCGDLMSGMLRLIESIVISMAIACGFAVPILIFS